MRRLLLAAGAVVLAAAPAHAQGIVDEFRVGVLAHDVGVVGGSVEDGPDINAEVRFVSPQFLSAIWSPRPHLGVDANVAGDTSQLYFGLTWEFMLWSTGGADGLFIDASLGGAVHNGKLDTIEVDRKSLGSRVLFRESLELGYRFAEIHSLSFMLDHISNANLADRNEGLDNFGIRYGMKF